jgi:hypothetical protein
MEMSSSPTKVQTAASNGAPASSPRIVSRTSVALPAAAVDQSLTSRCGRSNGASVGRYFTSRMT